MVCAEGDASVAQLAPREELLKTPQGRLVRASLSCPAQLTSVTLYGNVSHAKDSPGRLHLFHLER